MKKFLLFLLIMQCSLSYGQIFIDEFDDGDQSNSWYAGTGFTSSEENGEWIINGDGTGGAFDPFGYILQDDTGAPLSIDITETNSIYVRAKASNLGTSLRMDVKDSGGFVSTVPGVTTTLVSDYVVFEFNFDGNLVDGGYGGTACDMGPCPVDGTQIVELNFFVNPGIGAWAGTVIIDFISVGTPPQVGPMSDVFQDEFDDEVSLNYMNALTGYTNVIEDGKWKIVGDGTNPMWDNVSMLFYNTATLDTTDVSLADGDDKLYVRMRTDVPGTTVRIDIQDINNYASTAGSITKLITEEWVTYEYNYAGSYQDLAYGGTGCEVGPCDLDAERITNMIWFINPGVEGFAGEVEIEYISVGTALEPIDPNANQLEYGDHFSQDYGQANTTGAYGLSIENSELTINGMGIDDPFSAVAISLHDEGAGENVNATGNNKIFLRVKSDANNTLLRVDLIDTAGYITTQPSFTRLLEEDYNVIEIDFSAAYLDGGYGGTPCEMGPCPVDGSAISTVLLYPNPVDGGFNGNITVDFVSFGAPMGEDVPGYEDHFDNEDKSFWSDAPGFTVEETGTELTIIGDGTAGQYTAFDYMFHDSESGELLTYDLTSNNKLYVKASSTVANVPLRIDLVDADGFVTTEPSTIRNISEDYSVLEFDFTNTYTDGGYGGTACDTGPCPVDGSKITGILVYIDPDIGGFNGTVTLDWLSLFEPLETIISNDPEGIDDYSDEFDLGVDNFVGTDGIVVTGGSSSVIITGDGTSGQYAPASYDLNDDLGPVIVNAENNDDRLYVRVKSTVGDMPLRIDLQDNMGFHTTQAGVQNLVQTEYSILEYVYSGAYLDGGFGGTACDAGPCPVDGKRISNLQLYLNPGIGAYDGIMEIDWVAFGDPLSVDVVDLNLVSGAKLYPNPVNQEVYIDINSEVSGNLSITISSVTGEVVYAKNHGSIINGQNNITLTVEGFSSGMYILQASIDGKPAFTNKITKL